MFWHRRSASYFVNMRPGVNKIWSRSSLPKHNLHSYKRFWFQGIPPSVKADARTHWESLDAERTRQYCYWWRALLLKLNNDHTQGMLWEQKEWKACLAFLDFSSDRTENVTSPVWEVDNGKIQEGTTSLSLLLFSEFSLCKVIVKFQ